MSYTILGRGHSHGVVGKNELFFLWCMKEKKKINGTYFLCSHIGHIVSKHSAGSIVVGGMMTIIAKSFSFNPDQYAMVSMVGQSFMDRIIMTQMKFCIKRGDVYVLVDGGHCNTLTLVSPCIRLFQ